MWHTNQYLIMLPTSLLNFLYFTKRAFSPCAARSRGPSSTGMNSRFRYYEKSCGQGTEVVSPDCVVDALLLQHQPVGVAFSWPQNIFPKSCWQLVFWPVISWKLSCWKIIVTRKRAGKHVHVICKKCYRKYPQVSLLNSPKKILIKMRAKTPGNGIAGRRGEF